MVLYLRQNAEIVELFVAESLYVSLDAFEALPLLLRHSDATEHDKITMVTGPSVHSQLILNIILDCVIH